MSIATQVKRLEPIFKNAIAIAIIAGISYGAYYAYDKATKSENFAPFVQAKKAPKKRVGIYGLRV